MTKLRNFPVSTFQYRQLLKLPKAFPFDLHKLYTKTLEETVLQC